MQNKKTAFYVGTYIAALAVLAGGYLLDRSLSLFGVFSVICGVALAVGALFWLIWYGNRPRFTPGVLPYALLGLIPVCLHGLACFGPINPRVPATDYIWSAVAQGVTALWMCFFILGVGGSLLAKNGRFTPFARAILIASFGLPSLVSIFGTPDRYAECILAGMILASMGAFLTVIYEYTGKLWAPMALVFAYLFVGEFFRVGSLHYASLGGAVYYVILICNIMLFGVGSVYLYRLAGHKKPGKNR